MNMNEPRMNLKLKGLKYSPLAVGALHRATVQYGRSYVEKEYFIPGMRGFSSTLKLVSKAEPVRSNTDIAKSDKFYQLVCEF